MIEKPLDPRHQTLEDVGDVRGPALPVLPVPALLDDLRVDGAGRKVERREGQRRRIGQRVAVDPVSVEDDAVRGIVVEVNLVDLGIQAVVM